MNDLQIREFQVRSVDKAERIVTGRLVSYNRDINFGGGVEQYRQGVFGTPDNVKMFYGHNHLQGEPPIGKMVAFRETPEGPEGDFWLSDKTQQAREVWGLIEDDILNRFSVGYKEVKNEYSGDTIIRTAADLKEVSIVPMPADEQAAVTNFRDNQNNKEVVTEMTTEVIETTSDGVAELRAEVEASISNIKREVATIKQGGGNETRGATVSQYRTGGDLLKGLLKNDEAAKLEVRLYSGATSADSAPQPAWANELLQIVVENRDVFNLFSKAPHPGTTSITLPVLSGTTGSGVSGEQLTEGADLVYTEVRWDDVNYANRTFGNYASLSRQAIELGTPGYLQGVLEFQAGEYAADTEKAVTDALYGATGTASATLSANTLAGWTSFIIDAVKTMRSNKSGLKAEFMLVSADVFEALANLNASDGRPLLERNGDGSNTVGSSNILGLSGNIMGLPVFTDVNADANTCYITNSRAVKVMESAGAPVRLQDDNIINLTKDFSLYGYIIVAPVNKLAIVKGTVSV